MSFGLTSPARESVDPFCASGGLFEIEQFAVWLRIKRIARLEVLQAKGIALERSEQFDQIGQTCSYKFSALWFKAISTRAIVQQFFDRREALPNGVGPRMILGQG